MRNYVFSIPGAVGYTYIKAHSLKQAESIAIEMCQNHSFLGGIVQPTVTEVGKSYADSK